MTGCQTNEAPVKYLLRSWPNVLEILCIVTQEAAGALEWFQSEIQNISPQTAIREIPYTEGMDFTSAPLSQIMEQMHAGDELLLDITGGLRDTVMELLLVSRALTYIGVHTVGAVYSNYNRARIEDVTHLIGMFDLIGGMQEFSNFGSTRTLRAYYGSTAKDYRIEKLLGSVEHLLDCITLCRTDQLETRLSDFDAALEDAESCDDPMMKTLLPAFRKKYGKKLTVLGLIRWCVQSDMLQQALTLYKERIPSFLLKERADLLTLKPGAPRETDKDYQSVEEAIFVKQFIDMGRNTSDFKRMRCQIEKLDAIPFALQDLYKLLPYSHFDIHCSLRQFQDIAMDYFYIRVLRNMTNHANDATFAEPMEHFLIDQGYPPFKTVKAKDVVRLLENAIDHLRKENYTR